MPKIVSAALEAKAWPRGLHHQSATWLDCDSGWLRHGMSSSRAWWTTPLTIDEQDLKLVFRQTVVISNSSCDVYGPFFHTTEKPVLLRATQQPTPFRATHFFSEENSINFD